MVTFLTVLKSKKELSDFRTGYSIYKPEHVYALKKQIEKYYPHPHRFICLTDFEDMKCESIKLLHNFIGWWSKMELFRSDIPGEHFFYFDLDTVLVGDISCYIDAQYTLAGLAEVQAPGLVSGRLGSGVMAWRGDHSHIYKKFMENSAAMMEKYAVGGDQHIINDIAVAGSGFKPMQEIDSGCINYKHNLPDKENPPANAKIIYYHGVPKPWETNHRWQIPGIYKEIN